MKVKDPTTGEAIPVGKQVLVNILEIVICMSSAHYLDCQKQKYTKRNRH